MRKFESTNRIHESIYRSKIDFARPVTTDIHRVLIEVLEDLGIRDDALENRRYQTIAMAPSSHSHPVFNHDKVMAGIYEYYPDRDRIVVNAVLDRVWDERVAYRVLYFAVLERKFFLDLQQEAEEQGLAAFLDGRGPLEIDRPWLPRLAQLKKAKRACKVPEAEVVAWRDRYKKYLIWDDPDEVIIRRALLHAIEKEHREERTYRLAHTPELFPEEYVPIWERED